MCNFGSCQTRFEFLSQFRKVRNAFECFVTQVQTHLPKTKRVWPMKINVICTMYTRVIVIEHDSKQTLETNNYPGCLFVKYNARFTRIRFLVHIYSKTFHIFLTLITVYVWATYSPPDH